MLDQSVVFLVLNIAVRPFICHEKWYTVRLRRFASVVYISWRTSIMNYLQGTLYTRWILAPIAYSKWRNYDMRSFISSQISLSHHMSSNSILSTGVAKHFGQTRLRLFCNIWFGHIWSAYSLPMNRPSFFQDWRTGGRWIAWRPKNGDMDFRHAKTKKRRKCHSYTANA